LKISAEEDYGRARASIQSAAEFYAPPVPADDGPQETNLPNYDHESLLERNLLILSEQTKQLGPATAATLALKLIAEAKSKVLKTPVLQNPDDLILEELRTGAEIGKEYEDFEVTGAVFEKLIEPTLIQPTFVTHLPKELVPLAKLTPDDPTTVEVFECCINGQEISPGYTEQNDPIAQRTTLEHQAGGEQQKLDEDFLVALEHGMPPAGGIGIGIDRLCMMLLGQESIRDVILFPQLKPK
jgi:lysyl-tRNA synthetase class II